MCGFIPQLAEHRTGIAEVMSSNPVEALICFFRLLSNCSCWKLTVMIILRFHLTFCRNYQAHLIFQLHSSLQGSVGFRIQCHTQSLDDTFSTLFR